VSRRDLQAVVDAYLTDPAPTAAIEIADSISVETDPIGFEQAVEALLFVPDALEDQTRSKLFDALVVRAAPTSDPRLAYCAAVAMEGSLRLALADQTGRKPLDFVAALRDAPLESDATWALAASRCVGLADTHFEEPSLRSALRGTLRALAGHPDAAVDAAVELARARMTDAFASNTMDRMIAELDTSAGDFVAAVQAEEDRIDAVLLANCLLGLVAFARNASPDTIAWHAQKARDALRDRALYAWPSAVPVAFRRAEEALWGEFVAALTPAQTARHLPHWGDSAKAARALADAARASRTVRVAPAGFGPHDIVVPTLVAGIAERHAHRATLAAAIDQDAFPPEVDVEVRALLQRMEESPKDPGGDEIEGVLGAEMTRQMRETLDPTTFEFVREAMLRSGPPRPHRDAQWTEVFDRVLRCLDDAPDLAGPHKPEIRAIVAGLIDFVSLCLTHQLNYQGGALEYLALPDATEDRLSDHLDGWLSANAGLPVDREVPNQGFGGRTDVRITVGRSDRFVVECKRERKITDEILAGHLAQTRRYTSVSLRVSGLAILDLSDKSEGDARGLDGSVSVRQVSPNENVSLSRHVVVLVIPGNRVSTPSLVGRATRRQANVNEP
jgi:hypothetical protein